MTDHEDMENSIAAMLLGAADDDETASLRAHLEACSSCREVAQRLKKAADALPLSAPEAQPPARLRAQILAAAGASPRIPVRVPPARPRIFRFPVERARKTVLAPLRAPSHAAVAVLALALVGFGAWNLSLGQQLESQRVTHYSLSGSGSMATARATVTAIPGQNVTLIDFRNMPPLPPEHVYELWLQDASGRLIPARVFSTDSSGSQVVLLNDNVKRYTHLAVTVERGPDGAQSPSQQPQLIGQIA
jgi:hypothetical protein